MYFTAIADNQQRAVKENLNDFNELQCFMNKMEKRGFLRVTVTAHKINTTDQIIMYNFNGQSWEK